MMMVIDCWGGSAVCFVAGYISTESLAAMNILTNIMCVLYMVGQGFEQAACAIIGKQLGKGDVKTAKDFYGTIRHVAFWMIMATTFIQYVFRKEIVEVYLDQDNPDIESVRTQALAAIPLFVFNIFPDLFKGMLSGIIKALAI